MREGVDHEIKLKPGTQAPYKKSFPMTSEELKAIKRYLDDLLERGYIRPARSGAASPIILVRKPSGGIRVCVDYRALNAITERERYSPPEIRETLMRFSKAKYFTKLDVIAAFNRIRVKEGHEHLTAFSTRFGQFEYRVMPFGLCNAPTTFQRYINSALHEYLDEFASAYQDDVIMFSETLEEHHRHVGLVLDKLEVAGLPLDMRKCEFDQPEVHYLGLIIGRDGIRKDPEKMAAIRDWQTPRRAKDVLAFLGFVGFYRRFIPELSKMAKPLTELTRSTRTKGKTIYCPFRWTEEHDLAFEQIKEAFQTGYRPGALRSRFGNDCGDGCERLGYGRGMSQIQDGVQRPVAFFSRKMSPAETNYEIYDKELLAIVDAFEQWRPELAGTADPVLVRTDHRNLEYFMTTKRLNRRQARWAEFLADYNFVIEYRPGKSNPADALTRSPGLAPESGSDEREKMRLQVLLPERCFRAAAGAVNPDEAAPRDVLEEIREATAADDVLQEVKEALERGDRRFSTALHKRGFRMAPSACEWNEGLLRAQGKIVFPADEVLVSAILHDYHDAPVGGHRGRDATFEKLSRDYWAPELGAMVRRYVKACRRCQQQRVRNQPEQGLLRPLPIAEHPWRSVGIDFKGPLPPCMRNGLCYRYILTVVDRFTKRKHFLPLTRLDAETAADAFWRGVWRLHGMPEEIMSDRGAQFTGDFWRRLCLRVGVGQKMSSAFHPQTNGQTEAANRQIKEYLAYYVSFFQDDWVDLLPVAEFAINDTKTATTGLTPFQADLGYTPRSGFEPRGRVARPQSRGERQADIMVKTRKALDEQLRARLTWAQQRMKESADAHRTPAPAIKEGDFVWLSTEDLKSSRRSKALDVKWIGPYRVLRVVKDGAAFELELPEHMGQHRVFSPAKIRLDEGDPLDGQERSNGDSDRFLTPGDEPGGGYKKKMENGR